MDLRQAIVPKSNDVTIELLKRVQNTLLLLANYLIHYPKTLDERL